MFTGVIGAVVQGVTVYFALVFTSQLALAVIIFFGRVCCIAISFGIYDRFLCILWFLSMITGRFEVVGCSVS